MRTASTLVMAAVFVFVLFCLSTAMAESKRVVYDDFSSDSGDWGTLDHGWSISDGEMRHYHETDPGYGEVMTHDESSYSDYSVRAQIKSADGFPAVGLVGRFSSSGGTTKFYMTYYSGSYAYLYRYINGYTPLAYTAFTLPTDEWVDTYMRFEGDEIIIFINGVERIHLEDTYGSAPDTGEAGFYSRKGDHRFDEFEVIADDGEGITYETLTSGESVSSSVPQGYKRYYQITVPDDEDIVSLTIKTTNATDDLDLFVCKSTPVNRYTYDWYAATSSGNETIRIDGGELVKNQTYYILVDGFDYFSTYTITAKYNREPSASDVSLTLEDQGIFAKMRIDYTLTDEDEDDCEFDALSTQIQYSTDQTNWYDASVRGIDEDALSSTGGQAHSASCQPLYWYAFKDHGFQSGTSYYVRIKPYDGYDYASSYAAVATPVAYTNALTDGSPAFSDDFDDNSQWTELSGSWSASGGIYSQTESTTGYKVTSADGFSEENYDVYVEGKYVSGTDKRFGVRFRNNTTSGSFWDFYVQDSGSGWYAKFAYVIGGYRYVYASYSVTVDADTWYRFRIVLSGDFIRLTFDDQVTIQGTLGQAVDTGGICLWSGGGTYRFDNCYINKKDYNDATVLSNGSGIYRFVTNYEQKFYKIAVASEDDYLSVCTTGSSGDIDLYLKHGSVPSRTDFDYVCGVASGDETINVIDPDSGDWYVLLDGFEESPFKKIAFVEDLTVGSGEQIVIYGTEEYEDIIVNNGGEIILMGSDEKATIIANSITVNDGGKITVEGTGEMRANTMTIASSGEVDGSAKGYEAGTGPGAGDAPVANWKGGGGGGYGGGGGDGGNNPDSGGPTYGSRHYPIDMGSGGGSSHSGGPGGPGGGAVLLFEITGTLTINGTIKSNGGDGQSAPCINDAGGGGSGGSVFCKAGTITGSGSIYATGGDGGDADLYDDKYMSAPGGGGGGGRVAVYGYTITSLDVEDIDVSGGAPGTAGEGFEGTEADEGEDGTVEFKEIPLQTKMCTACACPQEAYFSYDNTCTSMVSGSVNSMYTVPGLEGVSPSFAVFYNSGYGGTTTSSLGKGWTHSFNESLYHDEANDVIYHTELCGHQVTYQFDYEEEQGETTYRRYKSTEIHGKHSTIVMPVGGVAGSYTLTEKYHVVKHFDDYGKITYIKDANGNQTDFTYDGGDKLERVEYPDGRCVKLEYDGSNRLEYVKAYERYDSGTSSYINQIGDAFQFTYTDGKLTGAGDWDFEYVTKGSNDFMYRQKLEVTSGNFRTTEFTLDNDGRVSAIKDSLNNSYDISIDPLHLTTTVTDRENKVTTYTWDQLQDVITSETDPLGNTSTYEWDGSHNMTKSTTPFDSDIITENTYDDNGNMLITKTYYSGTTTTYTYSEYAFDSSNNVTTSWGPCEFTSGTPNTSQSPLAETVVSYNYGTSPEEHNLMSVTRKLSSSVDFVTAYEYHPTLSGKLVYTTENYGDTGNERVTKYEYYTESDFAEYEVKGMLSKTRIDPANEDITTEYWYYGDGRLYQTEDPAGTLHENIYDDRGRLVASCSDTTGGGLLEGYITEYNISGEVVATTSGKFSTWTPATSSYEISSALAYSQTDYKYDALGRLIATKDKLSLGSVYTYDNEGRQTKVQSGEVDNWSTTPTIDTAKAYSEVSYTYYDNGWSKDTVMLLDSSGGGTSSTVTSTYYDNGSLEQVTGPKYDDSNDMVVKYEYDYMGRTTKTERLVDVDTWAASQTTYDEYGRVASTSTPEQEVTNYNHDDYTGWLISVISPETRATTYEYNDFGETVYTQSANPNGSYIYSHTLYDDLGRATHAWTSNSTDHNETAFDNGYSRSETHYESGTNRVDYTSVYDDGGSEVRTEYKYDALGRVYASVFEKDDGNYCTGTVYTFDELGRTETVHIGEIQNWSTTPSINTSKLNIITESQYDAAGRLEKSIQNPDGGGDFENLTTWYRYDELSRQTKVYDPKGYAAETRYYTEYFYDNAGRLTKVTNAESKDTEYTYYESGSRKTMSYTNQAGTGTVEYFYYASGQLKRAEYPGCTGGDDITEYTYDLDGRLDTKTTAKNKADENSMKYVYNGDGQLVSIDLDYNTGADRTYTYNSDSGFLTNLDDDNTNLDYTYNNLGRLTSILDDELDKTVSYTYYDNGLRETMETPDYRLVYEYDKASRLVQIDRGPDGSEVKLAEYAYNVLGQRETSTRYKSGPTVVVHTQYDYMDDTGWLVKVENRKQVDNPGSNVISSFQYYDSTPGDGHDLVGNREYLELANGENVQYTYDKTYQLLTETRETSAQAGLYSYTWTYDDAGNRVTQNKTVSGSQDSYVEYAYNTANQLIDEDRYDQYGGTWQFHTDYVYDGEGNMTAKDVDDKIGAGDEAWDYIYTEENRLEEVKKDDSTVGTYICDARGNRVQSVAGGTTTRMLYDGADCVADYNAGGTLQRYYVTPGLDENMLQRASSNDYYYTQDGLGSVREVVNDSQVTQNTYDYEAFGSAYSWSTSLTNRYTYTGREWDSESSTYYYRARQYIPSLGRFAQQDLFFAMVSSLYVYIDNNPIVASDPLGYVKVILKWRVHFQWTTEAKLLEIAKKAGIKDVGKETEGLCTYSGPYVNVDKDNDVGYEYVAKSGETPEHYCCWFKGGTIEVTAYVYVVKSIKGKKAAKEVYAHEMGHKKDIKDLSIEYAKAIKERMNKYDGSADTKKVKGDPIFILEEEKTTPEERTKQMKAACLRNLKMKLDTSTLIDKFEKGFKKKEAELHKNPPPAGDAPPNEDKKDHEKEDIKI